MREIKPELTEKLIQHVGSHSVAEAMAYRVDTFRTLVETIANLAYLNKDYLLFYRGQTQNFLNSKNSATFYPSIYRGEYLKQNEIRYQFEILGQAATQLVELFKQHNIQGYRDLKSKTYIQWSILQHYNVCKTPLLDFTHSLRVACSFAQLDNSAEEGYVYVFGLPYITNRISYNSEHDLVNIRLLSICPPKALRPYFQEGYLAGTTDITYQYDNKSEMDFNKRLIAKFEIPNNEDFWGEGNKAIPKEMLFPELDEIERLCQQIQAAIPSDLHPGEIGNFITAWARLEQMLIQHAQIYQPRMFSIRQAAALLVKEDVLSQELDYQIDELRKFRNILVHEPKRVETDVISRQLERVKELLNTLNFPEN